MVVAGVVAVDLVAAGGAGAHGLCSQQANDRPRPWFLARTAGMAAGALG